jgi:hypothetical protein
MMKEMMKEMMKDQTRSTNSINLIRSPDLEIPKIGDGSLVMRV